MSESIKDGTGTGVLASVSSDNKLRTRSVTETRIQHATELGNAYNINTGDIGSLATGESALLYFYNGEDTAFSVDAIAVGIKDATGSNIHTVTVVKNPTAGTLVSGATNVDMKINRNFGSAAVLSESLAYKGADTLTLTDGEDVGIFYMNESGRLFASVDFIIPKSKSIGIKLDLNISGTTTAYVALIGHQEVVV
jgi:hypothetical protein